MTQPASTAVRASARCGACLRGTLPLSTPALASYGAIVFIVAWNDLLIPLILNNRAEFMTLPVVIARPGQRSFRLPQPHDGDLSDRARAIRDPGIAIATLRGRRPLCRRNEGLICSISSTIQWALATRSL